MAEITLTTLTPPDTIQGYRVATTVARRLLRTHWECDDVSEDQWRERQRLIVLLGELETWLGELEEKHDDWLAPPTP